MKALRYAVRSFGRELRSGEVLVLMSAIILAVAALTAVGFLTDRISKAVARQANEILAADLRLRSQDVIPDTWREQAEQAGLQTADMLSFPSVVFAGDTSVLMRIVAVSEGYPLRGAVRTSQTLFGAEQERDEIPQPGTVWIDSAALARVGAQVSDTLEVGEASLRIASILTYRPDQSIGFASLAPTLLMHSNDIPETGLIGEGSRVRYALLVAGEEDRVAEYQAALKDGQPDSLGVRSQEQSSERAVAAADRAQRFLTLTAVISLLLSAVAVAMSARRFSLRRMDTVALMKSLGASQGFVVVVALIQLLFVGVIAVIAGSVLGYAAEAVLSRILADLIAGELPPAGPMPVLLATGSALLLLFGFALPALLQLRETPPLRVLRHDAMAPAPSRLIVAGLALVSVAALLYRAVGDPRLLVIVLAGILLTGAALYLVGRLLVASLGRFRAGVGVAWRYGLANVARRGRASAVQVVAFGLGLTVLLLLTLVRTELLAGWQRTLDESAPNHFLINIQRHELDSVQRVFAARELDAPLMAPMVRARMTHINDRPVKDIEFSHRDGEWFVSREQNLSWAKTLSGSNKLVAGEWWPQGYAGPPLVSVEKDVAEETGLAIGDQLQFEVAGQVLQAEISSIREINWDSFQPNFFLVFSPGALDAYPATFIASLRVEQEQKTALADLVREHPTVSVIDLDSVLRQIRSIIEKASLAVQVVFLFTLAAGVAVLFAAVQSTIDERRFESAMLRALGAKKRIVFAGVIAEFAALGAAAGLLASASASVLAYLLATRVFNLPYVFSPWIWLAGTGAGVLIVCASGYIAARNAINSAPVDVLRGAAV